MVIKAYKCDECGKIEPWGPGWQWKSIPRKGKESWDRWEEDVHVCSDACARQFNIRQARSKGA